MRILALDISSKTGWSLVYKPEVSPDNPLVIKKYGRIVTDGGVDHFGKYPFNYLNLADRMSTKIHDLIQEHNPDHIVIEETNKGRSRYSQKMLEYIHCKLLDKLWYNEYYRNNTSYINSSDWRKVMNVYMTKEDKKNNAKVNKARREGKSKKSLGLKGKITRKHIAIRIVNERYGIKLLQKENDIAEAICLGVAFCHNPPICNGK